MIDNGLEIFKHVGYDYEFIYFVFSLFFFFLTIFIFLNKNLFYSLFCLILIFILNLLIFIYVGCFFQGFVILLLYVGAITVLFLFLMMLFDFRAQFFFSIPIVYFLICFGFLVIFLLFLFNLEVNSIYFNSFCFLENNCFFFFDSFNKLDFVTYGQIFSVNICDSYVDDYHIWLRLDLFDFDRKFSQLYILNDFVYKNCFYLSIILLVGFFSLLVLLVIFFLLRKR